MKEPDELVKKLFQLLGCPKEMKLKTTTIKCNRKSFEITDEQWESLFGKFNENEDHNGSDSGHNMTLSTNKNS